MAESHFSGPLTSGDLPYVGQTNGPNTGYCSLVQTVNLTQNSTSAVSATMYIPAGSIITGFDVDVLTAFDSVTSAVLSIGITAGGTEYVGSVDVKAATGRIAITYTAAELAAMSGQSVLGVAAATTPPVVVTITPTGTTTAGYVHVTMHYVQLTSSQ